MATPDGRASKPSPRRRVLDRLLSAVGAILAILYSATLVAAYTPLTERVVNTGVVVDASAAVVWQVLTDLESYAVWNPFFQRASGTVAIGETLRLERHRDTDTRVFTPAVPKVRENRELRWFGQVALPGVFDGEHSFVLTPLTDDRVQIVQRESFRGVLTPFFGTLLDETEAGFVKLNQALKARAEARANP